MKKTALTIAGSDCSGGAGIQADLKTMMANGVFAMSVITAITAQNTKGVIDILNVSTEIVEKQMDAVFTDIYPNGIKIGMVSSIPIIQSIGKKLREYQGKNIVLDPVMVATSGDKLISDDAIEVLQKELFPLSSLITPNIPEGNILANMEIKDTLDMEKAAKKIYESYHVPVLLKGGHFSKGANDYFYDGAGHWITGERIDNPNTHGTGCTLSSAIAANLGKGNDLKTSIIISKEYLTKAIGAKLDLGQGRGPLDHGFMF
ncbi:MAG: bifunctional hydroxymethylpyrimidine kinase/phosphomethylpyrimidine kinase [Tissierellia bacterium]|nr:bifunctional hydroxymethylpyrimidine kinase/phosphomethylpyrimidine kinase [Tissierellia bacterium]